MTNLRAIAALTLVTFLAQQCLFAETVTTNPDPLQQNSYTAVVTPAQYEAKAREKAPQLPESEPTDSLSQFLAEGPLANVQPTKTLTLDPSPLERERGATISIEEASDLIREDFAYAAVIGKFTEEDLKTLLESEVEVGLVVLDGEIVLFTSGSHDEISAAESAQELFKDASLIAHTHPLSEQSSGPSAKDLEEAVESGEEYVITEDGVYVYDSSGVKGKVSYNEFVSRISHLVSRKNEIRDTKYEIRSLLNQFIADTDALNEAQAEGTLFRAGGTVSYNPALSPDNVSTLAGKPDPILTGGSSLNSRLTQVGAEVASIYYDVTQTGTWAGVTLNYDNFGTAPYEYADLSALAKLTFGLTTDADRVYFEIEDADGDRDAFTLINTIPTERIYEINPALISSAVDLRRVRFMNFVVRAGYIANGHLTGSLAVHAKGLAPSFVNQSPLVSLGSFSDLIGSPARVKTAGSSPGTSITIIDSQRVDLNYDVTTSGTYSGLGLNYDSFSTVPIESFDLTLNPVMAVGLEGDAEKVRLEIQDWNGRRANLSMENISSTRESFYKIDFSTLANELDLSHITFINFVEDALAAGPVRQGTLRIRYGTFVPDTTPPAVVITSPALTRDPNYTLAYTVDGVLKSEPRTLTEGVNTLEIIERDVAGNETRVNGTVTLDTIAPEIIMTSPAATNQSNFTLAYTVDGAAQTANFTLVEGSNTLAVTDQDAAGNSATANFNVELDTIPPSLVLRSSPLVNNPNYLLEYTVDGVQKQKTVTLTEGNNSIEIYEVDLAQNAIRTTHDVVLDTVAPSLGLVSPVLTNDPNYTLVYTSDGIQQSESRTLTEGANVISVTERDLAGNETLATWVVMLDTLSPQIAFRSPVLTNHSNYELQYYSDGVLITKPVALAEGENVIPVVERDQAGNETRIDYRVTLDSIPPEIRFTSAALTNQPFYALAYTVDGAARSETVQLAEGANDFTRSLTDAAGNTASETLRVTLDTIAPQVAVTSPALTNHSDYTFTYTSDGSSMTRAETLTEGVNVLTITERDPAGNETRVDFTVTVDTIAPQVAVTSPALTANPNYTLRYTSDGILLTVPITLAEGKNVLPIVERDAAGNETRVDFEVTLDTVAPQVVVPPPALTNRPDYTLTYTADGVVKTVPLALSEGVNIFPVIERDPAGNETRVDFTVTLDTVPPQVAVTSPALTRDPNYILSFTQDGALLQAMILLAEGDNTIARTVRDNAGNETPFTFTVTLDTIAPQVAVSSPALTANPNYTFVYTSDGVQRVRTETLAEGANTLAIVERDPAGNETRVDFTVTLDTIAPQIAVSSPALTNDPNYTLVYTSDGVQRVRTETLTEGANTLAIVERDPAGNETRMDFTVTLDTTAPQVILKSQRLTNQPNYLLEYTVDGQSVQELVGLAEGANPLARTFTDAAGNSLDVTFDITLDTRSPAVTLLSAALVNQQTYTLEYTVDGARVSEAVSLAEGLNVFHRDGQDSAGNRWAADFQIELDTLPPSLVVRSSLLVNNPNYVLEYTADGVLKSRTETLVEGTNTLIIVERDLVGNETRVTSDVTLDTAAPSLVVRSSPLVNDPNYLLEYTVDGILKSRSQALAEGANILAIVERDAAGNETRVDFTVTVDTIAPQVTVSSPALTRDPNYTLAYTSDGVQRVRTETLAEGANILPIVERDAAGNETRVDFTVTLDTTAPQIQFNSPALVNQPLYSLGYTSDGRSVMRSIFLAEGANILAIVERDPAGNETRIDYTVTLDTVAPQVVANSLALTNDPNYTLVYTSDGIQRVRTETLIEGANILAIVERDLAGNETRVDYTVTLDTIAPQVTVVSPVLTNDLNYTLTYTVDGIRKAEARNLVEGANVLAIVERDLAGNETRIDYTVTLDTLAPVMQITSPTRVVDASASLTYSLEYTVDGVLKTEPVTLIQGPNLFPRQETDPAGNTRSVTFTVLLDAPPPPDPAPPQIFLGIFPLPVNLPALDVSQPPAPTDPVILKDGSVLTEVELGEDGRPESFTRTLPTGVVQTVEDGVLKTQKNIDESVYEFDAFGGVIRIRLPDGSTVVVIQTDAAGKAIHYWLERASGERLEVVRDRVSRHVDPDGTVKVFDDDGVLVRIEKSDGQIWSDLGFGVDGSLTQLTKKLIDGTLLVGDAYTTNRQVAPDGTLRIFDPHTNYLIQIKPDQTREEFIGERKLREITADGTLMEYNALSQLQRVVNPDGSEIRYLADGGLQILDVGATLVVARGQAQGLPLQTSLLLGNGIRARYSGERISEIDFPDGTTISNPQFSETGELVGGRVEYPNGITDTVFNSNVIRREFPARVVLDFTPAGKLVRVLKDGKEVDQDSLPGLVEQSVLEMIRTTLEQGKIELADHSFLELKEGTLERETPNGLIQKFENGKLSGIKTPDGTEYAAVSDTEFRLKSLELGGGARAYFNESGFEKLDFGDGRTLTNLADLDLTSLGARRLADGRYSIQKDAFTYFYNSAGNLTEILSEDRKFVTSDGRIQQMEFDKKVAVFNEEGALDALLLASGEKYRFDRAGNLFQVVTPQGNKIIYQGTKISSFVGQAGEKVRLYRQFNLRTQTEEIYVVCHPGESRDPVSLETTLDSRFRGNDKTIGLIPYLLRDLDRSKSEALVTELADMFDITSALGAFYTPPDKAVESFSSDPERGRVSRLDYQVSQGSWMGLYAKVPGVEISNYEYISVGLKGGPGPVKIELKGTGQVFEFNLTGEWQDFVLPVKGRSGEISEITVLVNEPSDELRATGDGNILLDHLAFFTPKLEEKPDWQAETGITAQEIAELYERASQRIPAAKLPVLDAAMTRKLAETPTRLKYDASGTLEDLAFFTPPKPLEATDEKITTRYEYDETGALKSAKLDYQGAPVGNFEYKFEEGTTVIKGDDGLARRYDAGGVLVGMINSDGTEYEMIYENGVLQSTNLKRHYLDGATRNYSDGKLSSIELADGTRISALTFGADGAISGGVLETPEGTQYTIENGYPKETRYPSGTVKPFDQPDYEVIGWQQDRFVVKRGTNLLKYDDAGNLRQVIAESGENLFISGCHSGPGSLPGVNSSRNPESLSTTLDPRFRGDDRQGFASVRYFTPREIEGAKIPAREIISLSSFRGRGEGEGVSMYLGDTPIYENQTGLVLLVSDSASGKVIDQAKFDLSQSGAAMQLALFLKTIPEGAFLMGSYGGGFSSAASDLEKFLIEKGLADFGVKGTAALHASGVRWAFIGRRGAAPGSALESSGAAVQLSSHDETRGSLAAQNGKLVPGTVGFGEELLGAGAAYHKNFDTDDPESGFFRVRRGNDGNFANLTDSFVDQILGLVASRPEVYVYFDGRYPSNWITEDGAIRLKSALASRGLKVIDADQLAELMRTNPKAAVIMSQDIAPDTILDSASNNFLVKDFLSSGGTMVWLHDTPFYYVGHAGLNQKTQLGAGMENFILGTDRESLSASAKKEVAGDILNEALTTALPVKPLQLWSRFERALVANPLDSRTAVLTRMDARGETEHVLRADGSEVFYEAGDIRKVVGSDGRVEAEYLYDVEGHIERINLYKEAEKIPGLIEEERRSIEKRRDAMLALLPDQEAFMIQKIDEEVAKQLAVIDAKISELERQRFQTITQTTGWWIFKKTKTVTVEVPGVASAIGELQQAKVKLREEGGKAKVRLAAEIANQRSKIETEAQAAIDHLAGREAELRRAVLLAEGVPVLAETYRQLLGRDPSSLEIESVIPAEAGIQGLDIATLRSQLLNSDERRLKLERREQVVAAVETMLRSREHTLTETEIANILDWLRTRNLHFGESAYGPLREMLKGQSPEGTVPDLTQLAAEAIAEDILSGVINPTTEGELVLSLNALDKVAHRHGLNTSAQKALFEELTTYNLPLITFVNGNHFVLVKSITPEGVTYFDQSIGEHGSELTVSFEDFKAIYSGVSLALAEQRERGRGEGVLTEAEAQDVRGSFFFLIPMIIGAIAFLGPIAAAVSTVTFIGQFVAQAFGWEKFANVLGIISQISGLVSLGSNIALGVTNLFQGGLRVGLSSIGNMLKTAGTNIWKGITTIASTVGNLVKGIGGFVGGLIQGAGNWVTSFTTGGIVEGLRSIGSGLASGIGKTFSLIGQGIVKGIDFIGNGVNWIDSKIGNLFSGAIGNKGASLSQSIYNNLVNVSVGNALGKTLDGIGLNPTVSRLITSIATGAYADPANFLGSGLKGLALQGVSEAALHLDLPPPLAAALTTVTGLVSGNLLDPKSTSIFSNFDKITPDLFSQGLTYLGTELGLSPTVSALIAGPVGGSLGALAVGTATHQSTQTILKNMSQEFTRGLAMAGTSIVVTKVFDRVDAPPAAENLIHQLLTQITAGLFRDKTGREPTAEEAEAQSQNVLAKLGEGIKRFGQGVKNAVGSVIGFGAKVVEGAGHVTAQGFKNAIGAFSSVFSPKTQEYIYQDIQGLRQGTVTVDGDIWRYEAGGEVLVEYDPARGRVIDFGEEGSSVQITGLGFDQGNNLVFDEAEFISSTHGGAKLTQTYKQGRLESWDLTGLEGQRYFEISGLPKDEPLVLDAYQVIKEGRVAIDIPTELGAPWESLIYLDINDGRISEAKIEIRPDVLDNSAVWDIASFIAAPSDPLFVLTNGIANDVIFPTEPPRYIRNLEADLSESSKGEVTPGDDTVPTPIYPPFFQLHTAFATALPWTGQNTVLDQVKDVLWWAWESQLPLVNGGLVAKIKADLAAFFKDRPLEAVRPMVGMGYSGGFAPLVEALAASPWYRPKSLVALGAAITEVGPALWELAKEIGGELKEKMADLLANPLNAFVTSPIEVIEDLAEEIVARPKEWAHEIVSRVPTFNLLNVVPIGVEAVANVYGTKDILAELGIGGYRDQIGGMSSRGKDPHLFNIEIEGADHFDYMRQDNADGNNKIISQWVAKLIEKSTDQFAMKAFLDEQIRNHVVEYDDTRNVYVVKLPGVVVT